MKEKKLFKKALMTIVIAFSCFFGTSINASATDIALLFQQILQYGQDWNMDSRNWDSLQDQIKQAKKIVNLLDKSSTIYDTSKRVIKISEQTLRTYKELERYESFLKKYSDVKIDITNAGTVLRRYNNRTKALYKDIKKLVTLIEQATNSAEDPLSAMQITNSFLDDYEAQFTGIGEDCKYEMFQTIQAADMASAKSSNIQFLKSFK